MKPFKNLRGGANLPHEKGTAEIDTVIFPEPDEIVIPMQQHIGAPCTPVVNKKDRVFVGTKVADSEAFVSAPIHSGVSGTVKDIVQIKTATGGFGEAIVIENDHLKTVDPSLSAHDIKSEEDLYTAARESGLVGLGGAGFPTHIKLRADKNRPIDTLIINAAECEPYITSDYRECLESPEDILFGIYLIKDILKLKRVIIAVESNKPKAIKILYDIAADKRDINDEVKLMKLKSHYPQGAEKVLIYTVTGRKVPIGKLPADVGCIVMNVTSVAVLARYIKTGMPLVSKRITVAGNAVKKPGNFIVPIGTKIQEILDFCEAEAPEKLIMGGPMMGVAITDTSIPLLKQNNAILAFSGKKANGFTPTNCINCGKCLAACPMGLAPRAVESAIDFNEGAEKYKSLFAEYCIECGSCAYACPAKRSLVEAMRLAKLEIKKAGAKNA